MKSNIIGYSSKALALFWNTLYRKNIDYDAVLTHSHVRSKRAIPAKLQNLGAFFMHADLAILKNTHLAMPFEWLLKAFLHCGLGHRQTRLKQ